MKYFLRKPDLNAGPDEQTEERQKFYISSDCTRMLPEAGGTLAARQEQDVPYSAFTARIREVGLCSGDKLSLEYWGFPKGLVATI